MMNASQEVKIPVVSLELLPKNIRQIFNMETYQYDFLLNHILFTTKDVTFLYRLIALWEKVIPRIESTENVNWYFTE